jgi:hypothetical protein
LLVVAALAGWAVLRSWETRSPERLKYDRIQVGMTEEEVDAIVGGTKLGWGRTNYIWLSGWPGWAKPRRSLRSVAALSSVPGSADRPR